jgi:hypothetical protein
MWDSLSPYQKSMAISTLAGPAVTETTGKALEDRIIPGTHNPVTGPLRVKDAMSATAEGTNGLALARNYAQLAPIASLGTDGKANDHIKVAHATYSTGLQGFGPEGSAVKLPDKYLSKVGAKPASAAGVGAMAFDSPKLVPQNYKSISVTPDGKVLAVPTPLEHTASIKDNSPEAHNRVRTIAEGSHPAQKMWQNAPGAHQGQHRGSVGGSAIVSGLHTMREGNPHWRGAVIAHNLFNNTLGD